MAKENGPQSTLEPKVQKILVYGVRQDSTWGPKWIDSIVAEEELPGPPPKPRRYQGDEFGNLLVTWLNEMRKHPRNRVAYLRVHRLLKTALDLTEVNDDPLRVRRIETALDRQIHAYEPHLERFLIYQSEPGGEVRRGVRPLFQEVPSGRSFREWTSVRAILELSQRSLLNRVRRCKLRRCGRWFYQRFPQQQFCPGCRKQFQSSVEFKAEHAGKQKQIDRLRRSGRVI